MITKVNKNGTLSFAAPAIDGRLLLAKRLVIGEGRVPGIIGAPVPHLQKGDGPGRVVDADDLFIDIGAIRREERQRQGEGGRLRHLRHPLHRPERRPALADGARKGI